MIRQDWSTLKKLMVLRAATGGAADVEDTETGNPVTFVTDLAKPLKSLVANFLPIQASGTPSPDNILPITGWTGLNVRHGGKNLLNLTAVSKEENGVKWEVEGQTIKVSGIASGYTALNCGEVNITGLKKITVSGIYGTTNIIWACSLKDKDNNVVSNVGAYYANFTVNLDEYPTATKLAVQIKRNNNVETSGIINLQVEAGETATAYEPYISTSVYPVTLTEQGEIYGGYVDLVTGEVWATFEGKFFKWSEGTNASDLGNVTRKRFILPSKAGVTGTTPKYCNIAPYINDYVRDVVHYYIANVDESGRAYCFLPIGTSDDTDVQFVYCLETPALITTLTPQQINAIKGNNTVWSDANDSIEVTYYKKQS